MCQTRSWKLAARSCFGRVAKLAAAPALGAGTRMSLWVQIPPRPQQSLREKARGAFVWDLKRFSTSSLRDGKPVLNRYGSNPTSPTASGEAGKLLCLWGETRKGSPIFSSGFCARQWETCTEVVNFESPPAHQKSDYLGQLEFKCLRISNFRGISNPTARRQCCAAFRSVDSDADQ